MQLRYMLYATAIMINFYFIFFYTAYVQVVNVTGLSVVVGLMSAADTLCPQVVYCHAYQLIQNLYMLLCYTVL